MNTKMFIMLNLRSRQTYRAELNFLSSLFWLFLLLFVFIYVASGNTKEFVFYTANRYVNAESYIGFVQERR